MREKKTRRVAATNYGARFTSLRIILASQSFRNKVHNAILHGSVAGAVLAIFGGICYIDTNILVGAVMAVAGMIWLGVFYLVNAEDKIFGGWS